MRILTEDEVIYAVIDFLKSKGWELRSHATTNEHGYDIEAVRGTERLIVEAKGAGSSKAHTNRYGLEFTKNQVNDHVAKAILKALRVVVGHSRRAAVAFPDNKNHREEVEQVHEALMTLGIIIFWVSADGKVKIDGAAIASIRERRSMGGKDELYFIQFLHPGGEHSPDSDSSKKWNCDDHKRKFMVNPGRCVRDGEVLDTELVFWGEWEPESDVVAHIERPVAGGPQYHYRPFYKIPDSYEKLQNTDPFVFGTFLYGNCQQHTSRGSTKLRIMECGSVILFGSHVDGVFVLDTVFVVRDYIDYDSTSYKNLERDSRVPSEYMDVTLNPLFLSGRGKNNKKGCSSDKSKSYRLYFGATYDKPVDGMFSFFPCRPLESGNKGFARPIIKDPCFIRPSLKQKFFAHHPHLDQNKVRDFWQSVKKQVLGEDLCLGIYAQIPARRP